MTTFIPSGLIYLGQLGRVMLGTAIKEGHKKFNALAEYFPSTLIPDYAESLDWRMLKRRITIFWVEMTDVLPEALRSV